MHDLLRRSRVLQTAGQAVGQTQPAFNLAQRQQAAFRGQPATVKTGDHGLALHWWQTREKRRNINHGGCSSGSSEEGSGSSPKPYIESTSCATSASPHA